MVLKGSSSHSGHSSAASRLHGRALLDSCTRVRVDVVGKESEKTSIFQVLSPFGNTIEELQTYPFFRGEWKPRRAADDKPQLREFGCSIALSLYLRFSWEFGLLMLLAFAFSLPHVFDNASRSEFRSQCRAALTYDCTLRSSPAGLHALILSLRAPWRPPCSTIGARAISRPRLTTCARRPRPFPPADHALVDGAPSDAPLFFGTGASPSPPPAWYADCGYTGKPIRRTEEIKALVGDLTNYKGEEVSKYDLAMQLVDVVLNGPLTWSLGTQVRSTRT